MSNLVIIKTTSHRSRASLRRVITDLGREQYRWTDRGAESGYYQINAEDLTAALTVKGIRHVKRQLDLRPCISF